MRLLKSSFFGMSATVLIFLSQNSYVLAMGSYKSSVPSVATKGWQSKLGEIIWQGGKWAFRVGGAVGAAAITNAAGSAATAATNHAIESWRQNQLIDVINQEEQNFYSSSGTPIPVTERNVTILMQKIEAVQSERTFIVECMNVYWQN